MQDPFRDRDSLLFLKSDGSVFEIDEECPFKNEEEFIVVIMLVPVKFSVDDPDADD